MKSVENRSFHTVSLFAYYFIAIRVMFTKSKYISSTITCVKVPVIHIHPIFWHRKTKMFRKLILKFSWIRSFFLIFVIYMKQGGLNDLVENFLEASLQLYYVILTHGKMIMLVLIEQSIMFKSQGVINFFSTSIHVWF